LDVTITTQIRRRATKNTTLYLSALEDAEFLTKYQLLKYGGKDWREMTAKEEKGAIQAIEEDTKEYLKKDL